MLCNYITIQYFITNIFSRFFHFNLTLLTQNFFKLIYHVIVYAIVIYSYFT